MYINKKILCHISTLKSTCYKYYVVKQLKLIDEIFLPSRFQFSVVLISLYVVVWEGVQRILCMSQFHSFLLYTSNDMNVM